MYKGQNLKWTAKESHAWSDMFNHALLKSYDWTMNWIKLLLRRRDVNNVNNDQTFMVSSVMVKLFGCIMESLDQTFA